MQDDHRHDTTEAPAGTESLADADCSNEVQPAKPPRPILESGHSPGASSRPSRRNLMPIYQCSYQRGLLTEDMKAKVAAALDGIQGTGL